MPIGPKITDQVRRIIAEVWLTHQDWVAKEVMAEVHTRLRKDNPNVKPGWPGISAIQIELKKLRNRHEEILDRGEDEPWTVQTLTKYEIPPEALPVVLKIWAYESLNKDTFLTIRQAKWIGRLYRITNDISTLQLFSTIYALQEKVNEYLSASDSKKGNVIRDAHLWSIVTGNSYFVGFVPGEEGPIATDFESPPERKEEHTEWFSKRRDKLMNAIKYTIARDEEMRQSAETLTRLYSQEKEASIIGGYKDMSLQMLRKLLRLANLELDARTPRVFERYPWDIHSTETEDKEAINERAHNQER